MFVVVHFVHGEDVARSSPMLLDDAVALLDRYRERYPFTVLYLAGIGDHGIASLPIKLGESLCI